MKRLFAVVILVLYAMLWASAALAQSLPDGCGQNPAGYARYLQEKFGEKPLWSGVPEGRDGEVEEGVKLYGYVNPDTGTWTVFAVRGGVYCIAKAGRGFKPDSQGPDGGL